MVMHNMTVSGQLQMFLLSCGVGFLLGILYDVFRLLRMAFFKQALAVFIQDVLYWCACAVCSFLFILAVNSGEIRSFLLVGELIGWLIYYLTLGSLVMKANRLLIALFKKLFTVLFTCILAPFRLLFRLLAPIAKGIGRLFKNIFKIFYNNSKLRLKQQQVLLYNLRRVSKKNKSRPVRGEHKK